jgi:pyruvate ferredoxin oxidoreductase gamma subunit
VLLGGFAGLCDVIELDAVTQALRDRFPGTIGDMNTTAATVACEYVRSSLETGSVHA